MRSENPSISVIMPTYNVGKYIAFCMESIIRQTFQDFELIVIDDVSTDDTYEILQKYAHIEGVNLQRNPANKGAWYIRNIGRKQAKGKYIFFMDSDDELLPWALEDLYKKAEEEQADVVHTNRWIDVYTEGRMMSRDSLWKQCGSYNNDAGVLEKKNAAEKVAYQIDGSMPMPWLNLCRRDFLEKEQIEFPPMFFGDDCVFSMEICIKAKRYVCMNEPMYLYRCFPYQKERMIRRFPKALAYVPVIIGAYTKMFAGFSDEDISFEYRHFIISQLLFSHLKFCVFDIMDAENREDFATISNHLQPLCGEGAEYATYLLVILQNAMGFREKQAEERKRKILEANRFLDELESGKSSFVRNYSYIYSEANLAVHIDGGDDDFYCRAYGWLADAALELGQHKEAVEIYDKAASYVQPDSEKFMQIVRKRLEAEQYLEDEWDRVHLQCRNNPALGKGAEDNRHTIFGTIVHYKQITDGMIRLWLEILKRVPGAVLLVKADEFAETAMMVEAGERFLAAGIDLKRLQCKGLDEDIRTEYQEMDIFLGTYPIQDIERLQHALSMGIPAVVLEGPRSDQRLGSIMNRAGINGFAVSDGEEYVCKAVELASRQ